MSLWEDVKSNLVELYTTTSEKTSEIARVTTRKYDKFGISRDIERQFSELGNLVYTAMKEGRSDILDDPAIAALRTRIDALEQELTEKEREIDDIRKEYAERKTRTKAAAATAGSVDDTVLKDPALEPGSEASAILVEPGTPGTTAAEAAQGTSEAAVAATPDAVSTDSEQADREGNGEEIPDKEKP